jgi:dihydrofolate synthase / folylpolyglutamate synthase
MNYNETLQYLYDRLPVFHFSGANAYKPGLENTIRLMDTLNHPYRKYKTIHVAGTNGKGSVSHFLSAILQSAGYKVGLYTSPHLVDFRERIRVNGQMIDKEYVVKFVEENNASFETIQPSFFEATMAMAFNYFADCEVDVAVIEVGLGGRLDSTNIISPELSIITNISFDHVEFLGDTIEKIATEKAGIIKNNIPVVIGETTPESKTVFEQIAAISNSYIYLAENEINIKSIETTNLKMKVLVNDLTNYMVGLTGTYQLKNIATVLKSIEILQKLGYRISENNIATGLENVIDLTGFMGRWQCFGTEPSIFVDTAHNFAGISELVNHINSLVFNKLHLVFGMVNDKDISKILQILPTNAIYYFSNAKIARALPANELKAKANAVGLMGEAFINVEEAVIGAKMSANTNDFILVFGSNFVVGEAIVAIKKANR